MEITNPEYSRGKNAIPGIAGIRPPPEKKDNIFTKKVYAFCDSNRSGEKWSDVE